MREPYSSAGQDRVPIAPSLLTGSLAHLEDVRLAGSRCGACNEVSLGESDVCPCCGAADVAHVALSDRGVLWSFTIARNQPPGAYKGPTPFVAFGIGLVELPDGVRVMAPLDVPLDQLHIGQRLALHCFVQHSNDDGQGVVAFNFRSEG